ncbi:MAG: LysR family transcriptional regulator [Clostridiales bacterium]|nr:LysR family transcriptional regulator [Clostridiales bacterium]
MNLYQLRYFALLARNGHFRKTAEQLCIAQPSLSHSISLLEQELGVSLFEKQGRRSALTPEGAQFLSYVEKSLNILDEGIQDMQHIAMGEGIIELGFLRTLGMEFIPEMARGFLETQKEKTIYFKFHTGITASLIDGLKDEKYDIVFCTKLEKESDIEFIPVSRQDLVVIVPRNHPLSSRYTIDLEELAPYPQVYFSPSSGLRSIVDNLFEKIHVTPQIAYEIEEDIVIAGLVSRGFGVAVVPYMPDLLRMDLKIIQIASPYWERNFYMATLKTHHLTPAVKNFHDYVIAEYSDRQ